VLGLIGILACVSLGAGIPEPFFISSPRHHYGLTSELITSLIAYFQLPPDFFEKHPGTVAYSILVVILAVTLILLAQSLAQFRRAQTRSAVLIKYSVILAALVLVGSFCCADLMRSISRQWDSPLVAEVTDALRSVSLQDSDLATGHVRTLTPQELEKITPLSDRAKRWLRNSTIDVRLFPSKSKHFANARVYIGELHFPRSRVIVPFSWTVPDLESRPGEKK
jgi:hypothetical protein